MTASLSFRQGVAFTRTDEASPMHEVAINLFASDGGHWVDVHGSAVLIGPELALTARHNVEIFRDRFQQARQRGETSGEMELLGVQTWLEPAATVVHRVSRWFAAPWTDLAVLRLRPASDQREALPPNYRWRAVKLDLIPPTVGATIATFGFDDVQVTRTDETLMIHARGATSTGVIVELLDAQLGNVHHGWTRFQTNARFDGGMSGGPVMRDGFACGVVSTSLHATTDDEEHASFVPLLWPAMAIEIDDPQTDARTITLLDLAHRGVISARGHEYVRLSYDDTGRVNSVGFSSNAV